MILLRNKSKVMKYTIGVLLISVLLVGCNAQAALSISSWANDLITQMTNIEFLLLIMVGSFVGNSLSS